jgi:hypothetical protein
MIVECPNHEGSFDCNPFCRLCEGEQEYEVNEFEQAMSLVLSEGLAIIDNLTDEEIERATNG